MITVFETIDAEDPRQSDSALQKAAVILQNGGLVAFPTETVYGLGANGLDEEAVRKIYLAKGRPSDNPLILHVADLAALESIVKEISQTAQILIEKFWPGPLTLVFEKRDHIPNATSGGLSTIGVRMPENKIARYLIRAARVPIAAPSANASGKPSPTKASHVQYDLDGKIDMILDGGATKFGLESTIVDVSADIPTLLRPGSITIEMLREAVPTVAVDPAMMNGASSDQKPKAPGMKYTHYAPLAAVTVVVGSASDLQEVVGTIIDCSARSSAKKIGILATDQTKSLYDESRYIVLSAGDRQNPETIAANLFQLLRKFDFLGVEEIYAEGFQETQLGLSIMNRLKKAAGYHIINAKSR